MQTFWVYMVQCSDESYYIGHTDNLEKRIAEHNGGTIQGYTYNKRPVNLVWTQEFATRDEAFTQERHVKGWSRAKKKALVDGNWEEIKQLAKSRPSVALRQAQGERGK